MKNVLESSFPDFEDPVEKFKLKVNHLCLIYHNDDQRLSIALPLIVNGIIRRHRVIAVIPPDLATQLTGELENIGVNMDKLTDMGQFKIFAPEELLFTEGIFDTDIVIHRFKNALQEAQAAGWDGIFAIVDASRILHQIKETDWLQYELQISHECTTKPCLGLCLFDDRIVSGSLIAALIKVHPVVGIGDELIKNPYYAGPTINQTYPM